jgi:solute carrier family 50 protein (sugar transporter)
MPNSSLRNLRFFFAFLILITILQSSCAFSSKLPQKPAFLGINNTRQALSSGELASVGPLSSHPSLITVESSSFLPSVDSSTFSMIIDSALRVAGPIFFLGLQLSTVQTAAKLYADKSVGQLSPLQFVSLFTNCVIWSLYGILKTDKTVLYPNAIGVFAGLFSTLVYQKFTLKSIFPYYFVSGAIALYSLFLLSENNSQMLGMMGCILSVILIGAPLSALSTVVKDKSTESLPFGICLMGWLNSFSWTSYGYIIAKDPLVSMNNYLL